ncbi:MAG: UDP-N-acetylglucosamine--N-acetylmuramyl-(pentapeptide) pyrophosphoryl-undecaprenol N-acetylglucosamine transferase, partial [Chloroflexota bacterium]|nr:UDP-N-acetylglucosamine--N-acetylmuramyl-(pentapeptide) pyrophosphoryl-undecaprenol N-acetylglucosamine transferase [Chloroflexota bacterium]
SSHARRYTRLADGGVAVRVLLAGGGSGGSATPVLAVATELRSRDPSVELLYVGTRGGPEAELACAEGIAYVGVAAGKLRRYWDTQNVTDIGRIVRGVGESIGHVRRFRPDVAFGAGGFASVPPLFAAALQRVPVLIHQQDVIPGLANRLLVPFAARITVSLPQTLPHFPADRTTLRGNPVRSRILGGSPAEARRLLDLEPETPLVLVTGGGTGALALNLIVADAADDLVRFCQVVHLTGRGRGVPAALASPRYHQREFLVDEMPHALAAASVVVTRAGLGTLTELAALRKAAIVVPMPGTHQDANARAFAEAGGAIVLDQRTLTPEQLVAVIRGLLEDEPRRTALGEALGRTMPRDAAARVAEDLVALVRPASC